MNSAGSAMKENEVYINSISGKISNLKSAFENLSRSTVDSGFVKFLVDSATALVKFVDSAGGLIPVLTTLLGIFTVFKAQAISDTIKKVGDSITSVSNGFKILKQRVLGAKNAQVIYMDATAGATTATNLLALSVGSLVAVLSIAIQIYNAIKSARKAATEATIREAEESKKEAESKREQIKSSEEQLETLKNEKQAYLDSADAKDKASDNKKYLDSKQAEIDKVQENIDKLKEEEKQKVRSSVIQAGKVGIGDASGQRDFYLGGSVNRAFATQQWNLSDESEYIEILQEIDIRLEKAKGNIGAYNRALKEEKTRLEEVITTKKANNESTEDEYKALNDVEARISKISEEYNNASKTAEIYYNAIKSGFDFKDIGITEDDINRMQEFYGLTDDQIELLKQGQDVLNDTADSTENLSLAEEYLAGVQKEEQESQEAWRKEIEYTEDNLKDLNNEIDNMQTAYGTLSSAVNEYNSSGSLSVDTLQSLLSLNGDYLSSLELVNGKLQISKKYQDTHREILQKDTLALIENAAMEDLKAQATGTAGQIAKSAGEQIKQAGLDGKEAGGYAKEGVAGFTELAGAMAQAGQVDLSKVDVDAWAKKWANATKTVSGMVSKVNLASDKFTGSTTKDKSTKSKSKKSKKDTYKAEINLLYKYENALENAAEKVKKLQKALGNTENFSKQEKILKNLIKATDNQKKKTNDLRKAQTKQIKDYIKQLKKAGFQIKYNSKDNELNIKNMKHLKKFTGDTAKKYEEMIKDIQSLNKENRSLSESITDLTQDMKDYNEELNDIPTKKLEKYNELMEEFRQGRLDQIQGEITDLEREMKKDTKLNKLKAELEEMEKQNDALDSQNDKQEKLLALEQAKENLANKREQKTIQVFREGEGWVWEADQDAIEEAQENLKNAQKAYDEKVNEEKKSSLEDQIKAIEDSYQKQIDLLQEFLDEQEYLIEKANRGSIQSFDDLKAKLKEFGINDADTLAKAKDWYDKYNADLATMRDASDKIKKASSVVYSSANQGSINASINKYQADIVQANTRANVQYSANAAAGGQTIYIDRIELPNVHNADDFVEALKQLPSLAISSASKRK